MGVGVGDWDVEQQRHTVTVGPVRPAAVLFGVVIFVLVAVALGTTLRGTWQERSFGAPTVTAATASGRTGDAGRAQDAAAAEQAAEILLGDGDLYAIGPNSLNLFSGQSVVLRNVDTEVRVTPGRVALGTGACAAGPLLTVELSVQLVRGSVSLRLEDFALLVSDGLVSRAIEACSTGFSDAALKRTVVFAAAQPGRLVYGPDPADPVAMWQLT